MNPGILRERLTLESASANRDALGQPVPGWTELVTVWARMLKPEGAAEAEGGDRQREQETIVWRVRELDVAGYVDDAARLTWRGNHYEKIGIARAPDGRGEYLDILSRRIAGVSGGMGSQDYRPLTAQGSEDVEEGVDIVTVTFQVPFSSAPYVTFHLQPPDDAPLIDAALSEVTAAGFEILLDAPIPDETIYTLVWRAELG
jgi:SPP1 family predicted phage head-tail adaptor